MVAAIPAALFRQRILVWDGPGNRVNGGGPNHPLGSRLRVLGPHASQERAAETAARTLALPDAQSVEDLTALLTSAGER